MAWFKKIIIVGLLLAMAAGIFWRYRQTHPRAVFVPKEEVTLTIIPGWNLRQVAEYLVLKGFASSTGDVYQITGEPARADQESIEGYLAPETNRFYADESLKNVISKFQFLRDQQITPAMRVEMENQRKTAREILTMASIIEKETKHEEDRAKVADILWRRVKRDWALQVDSSVHYAIGKTGEVFTTDKERAADSPWNTYKYAGLPPGPIANPSVESIKAALYPERNDYWYFLSGRDGKIYYAKTLEEHNVNKKYL